jgi:glycosyltransferase involved in cell wall biosynthesis
VRLKLAIVSTHPIQYYAPIFRVLAQSSDIHPRVFFTWSQAAAAVPDAGFGAAIQWDIPLLDGYEHEFVPNVAQRPGLEHFWGLRNPTLTRSIEEWGADAVLVFGWNLSSHLHALRYFKGRIPVFFRGDSTLLDMQPPLQRFARTMLLRWVYRHIDLAIAVGQNNSDYFVQHGVPLRRIAVAPHSIDTKRFAADELQHDATASRWRTELQIPEQALVLLYAGKLQEKKDPLLLLDAFLASDPSAHLVFCGNGVLEGEVRARANGHPRVRFLPFQNQSAMPAVYRLGDVFILPSRGPGETWGLALNEAMASGRPVIASSKTGGARDLVRERINGWTFESGNRAALVEVLAAVAGMDRPALRVMGEVAREASLGWSSETTAARIAQIVMQFSPTRSR